MKRHPILHLISHFIDGIDNNPKWQLRIHMVGFWYWTVNFPLIIYLYMFQPVLWANLGLFITLIYSIYANWTSDLTGISSSQSVINTQTTVINSEHTEVNL